MVRAKICGITRDEDAALAIRLGAWAIGFVFWPNSPRAIDPDTAARIAQSFPSTVTPIGVFVDQPLETVDRVSRQVGLGAVQLHGRETPEYARRLTRPVIKALTLDECERDGLDRWERHVTILLDAVDPIRRGGTGRTIDWERAGAIARTRPVILAGGLRPENLGEAVGRVRPFAVDVSSGVEASPGVKDAGRLQDLFAALNAAEITS